MINPLSKGEISYSRESLLRYIIQVEQIMPSINHVLRTTRIYPNLLSYIACSFTLCLGNAITLR
jgi:hypothetical protein